METCLENLAAFRARTEGFIYSSLPRDGGLETGAGLRRKADESGRLLPFQGCTTVFPLPEAARERVRAVQDGLYARCGTCLAQPLAADSFHITLHDLVSGPPSPALEAEIARVQPAALALVEALRRENAPISMTSTALFNMVNTSMVLGFAPADEESCAVLMEAYRRLQAAVPLNYPLTPHVTVAYFRPGWLDQGAVAQLQRAVDWVQAQPPISLTLSGGGLEYQIFSDMNHYRRTDR